ncbi:hypothetical protein NLG97_g3305 [Lecanicillium saksenae]|uniref:Uncharacterized protein n=1 Tax=Lecanicillium saksenae TaxID=468837 RepID=A0ACC1R087_9HYPO|nr:hypothetical protein NLG97_g3305 [Lecanicillium saksenae]
MSRQAHRSGRLAVAWCLSVTPSSASTVSAIISGATTSAGATAGGSAGNSSAPTLPINVIPSALISGTTTAQHPADACNSTTSTTASTPSSSKATFKATFKATSRRVKRVIVDGAFSSERLYLRNFNPTQAGPAGEVLLSAKEAARYNDIMKAKLDMEDVTLLTETLSRESPDRDGDGTIGESLACVALALVPNVTSIIFSTHYTSLGSFKPGTFLCLEAFSVQHADTELAVSFDRIEGVLQAAPALQRIIGWAICTLPCTASYPSVKELVLGYSKVDEEEMAFLSRAFPNLERFVYSDGGACVSDHLVASPRDFSEALLGLRGTLKSIQIESWYEGELFDLFDGDDRVMDSLASMVVLEHLQVYAQHIFRTDVRTTPPAQLKNFLPASIRSFCIEGIEERHLPSVLAVAHYAPGEFPALERATFPDLNPDFRDVVEDAYSESGIQCSFEPIEVNTYSCSCA